MFMLIVLRGNGIAASAAQSESVVCHILSQGGHEKARTGRAIKYFILTVIQRGCGQSSAGDLHR